MPASQPLDGIDRRDGTEAAISRASPTRAASRLLLTVGCLGCLGLLYSSSCSSRSGALDATVKNESGDTETQSSDDSDDDEFDDEFDDASDEDSNLFAFPKRATAWDTRTFVTTTPQPPPQKIAECFDQMSTIAADAGNQDDLRGAPVELKQLIAAAPTVYHACYFQLIVKLDERLDVGGPVMTELADVFFEHMKALWILARGLDAAQFDTKSDKRYFTFLQKRYIQLSKDYFGRDVQIVAPGLGDRRPPQPASAPAGQ